MNGTYASMHQSIPKVVVRNKDSTAWLTKDIRHQIKYTAEPYVQVTGLIPPITLKLAIKCNKPT